MSERTRDYDFNVWSNQPDTLTLTAYEQKREMFDGGYITMNSEKYHSITFKFPENLSEIEYLLQDLAINYLPLTDYDDWVDYPLELGKNGKPAPNTIAKFVNNLPEYEMEKIY